MGDLRTAHGPGRAHSATYRALIGKRQDPKESIKGRFEISVLKFGRKHRVSIGAAGSAAEVPFTSGWRRGAGS